MEFQKNFRKITPIFLRYLCQLMSFKKILSSLRFNSSASIECILQLQWNLRTRRQSRSLSQNFLEFQKHFRKITRILTALSLLSYELYKESLQDSIQIFGLYRRHPMIPLEPKDKKSITQFFRKFSWNFRKILENYANISALSLLSYEL